MSSSSSSSSSSSDALSPAPATPTQKVAKLRCSVVTFLSPQKTPKTPRGEDDNGKDNSNNKKDDRRSRLKVLSRSASFSSPSAFTKSKLKMSSLPLSSSTTTTATTILSSSTRNKKIPSRSKSMSSATTTTIITKRFYRPDQVDGNRLDHWNSNNFTMSRDASCRKVYTPKSNDFFQQSLHPEDYKILRENFHNNNHNHNHNNNHNNSIIIKMEQPFFSKYNRFFPKRGHFCCKACGNPLYGHASKIWNAVNTIDDDGWPAFGECVEGAIEMMTPEEQQRRAKEMIQLEQERKEQEALAAKLEEERQLKLKQEEEERQRQLERRRYNAATTIQKLIRGAICRIRLVETLDQLIEDLKQREEIAKWEEDVVEESWDMTMSRHSVAISMAVSSHHPTSVDKRSRSSHTTSFFSDDDDDDDEDSFASFGEEDEDDHFDDDNEDDSKYKDEEEKQEVAAEETPAEQQQEKDDDDEERIEIHCHRCKSHLGSIVEKESRGGVRREDGQTIVFQEHHRVNGRSIKYVEDNLPKRINTHACLLFANQSQARLMGFRAAAKKGKNGGTSNKQQPAFILEQALMKRRSNNNNEPFVSPRTRKAKLAKDALSKSTHAKASGRKFSRNSSLEELLLSRTIH